MLAGVSGTNSVCVCSIHQHVKLMFVGCNLDLLCGGEFTHYRNCLAATHYNLPTEIAVRQDASSTLARTYRRKGFKILWIA